MAQDIYVSESTPDMEMIGLVFGERKKAEDRL